MSGLAAAGGEPRDLHTATITPEVSGTVTVDIAAGAAQDSSGNPSAAADQFSITANTAAPTVTITSSASEPVTGAFSIAVTFSEPVNGFELADLVVGNGNASGLQGRRRGRSPDRGRPGRQPWPPQPRAPIMPLYGALDSQLTGSNPRLCNCAKSPSSLSSASGYPPQNTCAARPTTRNRGTSFDHSC